ncbi:MAG: hypothetical protein ACE5EA_02110 [Nitrospirota bacterium]
MRTNISFSKFSRFLSVIFIISSVFIISFFNIPTAAGKQFPVLYQGIRPLGMGNAFITLSDDENALFYNPAGLNDIPGFGGFDLLNPAVSISENAVDIFNDLNDVDVNDVSKATELLNKYLGKNFHLSASLLPNLTMHNFGIGGLASAKADGVIRNRANPELELDAAIDIGPVAAIAYGFLDKRIQLGLGIKIIQRQSIKKKKWTAVDIASNFDPLEEDLEKEQDFAFDLGAKINLPYDLPFYMGRPTIGIVAQNITDLDFKDLGKIPQQLNIGAAINPKFWILGSTFVIEMDDVTKNIDLDNDIYKRLHIGAELRLPMVLSIRGGFNQGYYTAGATIDLWILRLDYATFGEEIGAFAGQREDRRHIARLSLGF